MFVKIFYVNETIIKLNQIINILKLTKLDIKTIINIDLIFRLYYYVIILLEFD